MPNLIASKEFIDNLFVCSDSDAIARDLFSFIAEDFFGYNLICDFGNVEEYAEATKYNPIWELIMDKYSNIEFNVSLEQEVSNDAFYKKLDEQNIFLLSLSDSDCQKLTSDKGYIFVPSENISFWGKVTAIKQNGKFKVTNNSVISAKDRFNDWNILQDYILPTTGIIIFDRFILNDKDNQKLKDNLFKLLEVLCKNSLKKHLDLTIVSDFPTDKDLIDSHNRINAFLLSKNFLNIKLNILRHHKSFYPRDMEGLHYRAVWTNFVKYKCDDSFNFFKGNGKINNDADLHITFNLEKKNRSFFLKEISDLKKYISNIKNFEDGTAVERKIFYYKDKSNCLFNIKSHLN